MKTLILYHGSDHIVDHPTFNGGKLNNDYGRGFYCTQDIDLAKEWAFASQKGGFCNRYQLNMEDLNVFDLNAGDFSVLNWMAILTSNRVIHYRSGMEKRAAEYLIEHYLPDTEHADIIQGYRADDSYFSFARAFLGNALTVEQLKKVIVLGDLGQQICLKSEKAFKAISFINAEAVSDIHYFQKRNRRNETARKHFDEISGEFIDGTLMSDIMRGRKPDQ